MPSTDLHVLREISSIIAKAPDCRDGLHQVLDLLLKQVKADATAVFTASEKERRLVLFAASGRLIPGLSSSYKFPVDSGIIHHVFTQRETVVAAKPHRHPRFDPRDTAWAETPGGIMAFPIMVGGAVIGVVIFNRNGKQSVFTEGQVRFAEALIAPIGAYLQTARLGLDQAGHAGEAAAPQMMNGPLMLKGKAITQGVVRGKALLMQERDFFEAIPIEYAADKDKEMKLLQRAMLLAKEDTLLLQKEASSILSEADVSIFYAHLLLLDDPLLHQRLHEALNSGFTLRFALRSVADAFMSDLAKLDNELMRERLADVKDVILRIWQAVNTITGQTKNASARLHHTARNHRDKVIVVARELFPSQLIRLPLANLAGIICEQGGATTHVAILAKALHIPFIVGVPQATLRVRMDNEVILDCSTSCCYIRPSEDILQKFAHTLKYHSEKREKLQAVSTPAVTADNAAVRLMGNVSLVGELPLLERYGAMGIGLYRTEFMFMVRAAYPTEEEQYQVFRRIVEAGGQSSVTIRVLDVGGDKALPYVDFGQEGNSFLGWRGLRFLLSNLHYFEPHLRAILRATVHGRVNILLPMVADVDELQEALAVLNSAKASLDKAGIPHAPFHLGIMLEVPSAVWCLPKLLPQIDFVSIGTNDLIQYTFAVDRGNTKVSRWFRQLHPVILGMIKQTCTLAAEHKKNVSLCGEMAGTPAALPLLLGAGMRTLSMNPWLIPGIRSLLGKLTIPACEALLEESLACASVAEVEKKVTEFAKANKLRL